MTNKKYFTLLLIIIFFIFMFNSSSYFIFLEDELSYVNSWYPTRGYYWGIKNFNEYYISLKELNPKEFFTYDSLELALNDLKKKGINIFDFVEDMSGYEISYIIRPRYPLCLTSVEVIEIVATHNYGIIVFKSNPEPCILKILDYLIFSNDLKKGKLIHIKYRFNEMDTYFTNLYSLYMNGIPKNV